MVGDSQEGGRLTVETPFVGDVVHEEDSHRAPVVRRRDRPEPLLSRRVPLCVTADTAVSYPCARLGHELPNGKSTRAARTIWSLMRLPSSSMVRILKSIPMVVMKLGVQASSQNRRSRHDLPTPGGWRRFNSELR